jgi:hypothetical protein
VTSFTDECLALNRNISVLDIVQDWWLILWSRQLYYNSVTCTLVGTAFSLVLNIVMNTTSDTNDIERTDTPSHSHSISPTVTALSSTTTPANGVTQLTIALHAYLGTILVILMVFGYNHNHNQNMVIWL